MRARRAGLVVAIVVVVLVVLVGVIAPAAMSTPALRSRVLSVSSRAAGREVDASRIRITPFFTSVRLEGFSLAQPEGFPAGHALEADRLTLHLGIWRLLRGELVGRLDGRGLRANILRRGEHTSFDGLGGGAQPRGGGTRQGAETGTLRMNLDVDLRDGRLMEKDLRTGETVTLDGVGLRTRLANGANAAMPVTLTVASIRRDPLTFENVRIDAVRQGERWNIDKLATSFPGGGSLSGHGRFDPAGGWQLALTASAVDLDADMRPVAASLLPVLAAPGGSLTGRMSGSFDLRADGLSWAAVRRSLTGAGSAALEKVGASPDTVITRVATLAGLDASAARLKDASGAFHIENGWIRFDRLRGQVGDVPIDFEGRVSLQGRLDLTTDLAPLAKRIKGSPFQKVAGRTDSLPVHITGTVTHPSIAPPKPAQLTPELEQKAKDVLKGLLGH